MAWVEDHRGTYRVRLRLPDGTVVTDSSHANQPDAFIRATEIDVELARDRFLDPRDGQLTLTDWVELWKATHHAGPATWSAYRSHLRLHILPTLGHLQLSRIRRQHIKSLVTQLSQRLAPRSIRDVLTVLSLVLNEAVEDRRIPHNPARGIRIPGQHPSERPHASPAQVAQVVARLPRRTDQILVLTAAYTGLRWGELAGLQRTNLNLPSADL
jgi:integrase